MLRSGLDLFERKWPRRLKGSRVGLLVHPASVNRSLEHAVNLFVKSRKLELKALFGPQHGIRGETHFQPTFQKHSGRLCGGAQIYITNRDRFKPFKTGVAVLKAAHDLYPEDFAWRQPPYEYETEKMPIDILAGTDRLRRDTENGEDLERMEEWWEEQRLEFNRHVRKRFLIYK